MAHGECPSTLRTHRRASREGAEEEGREGGIDSPTDVKVAPLFRPVSDSRNFMSWKTASLNSGVGGVDVHGRASRRVPTS